MLVLRFSEAFEDIDPGVSYLFHSTYNLKKEHRALIYESTELDLKSKSTTWKDQKVLLWTLMQGWGDICISSALPRYLKTLGAQVFIACLRSPGWLPNPHTTGAPLYHPVSMESVQFFDRAFFLTTMFDDRVSNIYDQMFDKLGLKVPDEFKKPSIHVSKSDEQRAVNWLRENEVSDDYVIIQPIASTGGKSFPSSLIKTVLEVASELGCSILVTHSRRFIPEILELIAVTPRAINASFSDFGLLAAIVKRAKVAISPDSLLTHLSAGVDTPCLGIYGTHDPVLFDRYYPLQKSIWHKEACQNAGCFTMFLPTPQCPKAGDQKVCACFEPVTKSEISDALENLLKSPVV